MNFSAWMGLVTLRVSHSPKSVGIKSRCRPEFLFQFKQIFYRNAVYIRGFVAGTDTSFLSVCRHAIK